MIENNRPLEEVTEALKLVEIDYKTAVTKHEELVEKIDDEEYAKEEKWIEEIREKTLILKFRAKDYILKLKEAQVTQNKNEENQEIAKSNQMQIAQENSQENGNTVTTEDQTNAPNSDDNSQDVELIEENQNSVQGHLVPTPEPEVENLKVDNETNSCAFKVKKPKLPKFKGDVRDYFVFRADFKHVVESRYSHRNNRYRMRTPSISQSKFCLHKMADFEGHFN